MNKKLAIYKLISSFPIKLPYTIKFMLVAFIGTHIPMISVIIYLLTRGNFEVNLPIIIVGIVATLLATILTLFFIHRLLYPVTLTQLSLKAYRDHKKVPELPKEFDDMAGYLMRETQESLEELDSWLKLKNNMLSIISHDTRTPISSISMSTSLIDSYLEEPEVDKDQIKELLRIIEVSNRGQKDIINNIISVANFEDKEFTLSNDDLIIEELIGDIRDSFDLYFTQKDIEFLTEVDPSAGVIKADVNKLKAILNNLIQNSIKFTKQGGTVRLSINKAGEGLKFTVQDTGVGIEKGKLSALFDAHSESTSGTSDEKGTGLGLWIVKTFAKMHNGSVTVESEPGVGSTFEVYIPDKS